MRKLARGLLLQRRRRERRRRAPGVRLGLEVQHAERRPAQGLGGGRRGSLVELTDRRRAQRAPVVEVAPRGHPGPAELDQPRVERRVLRPGTGAHAEGPPDVPVLSRTERHPLALAFHHHAGRHRLHPAGRQALPHLAPQHRRHLVAVQAVEDAARLLRVHEALVEVPRGGQRTLDRLRGDLVEHHALDGHLGLELLEEVPRDGLALAVLIGGEEELVGVLQRAPQLGDLLLLVRVDDVVRLETVLDVDREAPERPLLHVRRQLRGLREVADVPHRRLDGVPLAEVAGDRARLGGRLHDHELAGHHVLLPERVRRVGS